MAININKSDLNNLVSKNIITSQQADEDSLYSVNAHWHSLYTCNLPGNYPEENALLYHF
ncbi:MAG: hypothetical protein JXR70_02145 [Spirochaetales bacterium]|nr:hypothetical protein [Spirochaetales bacterium]